MHKELKELSSRVLKHLLIYFGATPIICGPIRNVSESLEGQTVELGHKQMILSVNEETYFLSKTF